MTPKTAYIVFTQEMYEDSCHHFACLDRQTAERAAKEINDYKDALKATIGECPDTESPEWDAWWDRRTELLAAAQWPYGVNMECHLDEDACIYEISIIKK